MIANEVAELCQVVQQLTKLLHKQAKKVRRREKEIIHRQNGMFMTIMQQFPTRQNGGNRRRFQPMWNDYLRIPNYQDRQCQGNTGNNYKRKNWPQKSRQV